MKEPKEHKDPLPQTVATPNPALLPSGSVLKVLEDQVADLEMRLARKKALLSLVQANANIIQQFVDAYNADADR